MSRADVRTDECVARSVWRALRDAGESVESMIDRYGRGARDVDWLPDAGRNRLIVISKDEGVRRKRHEVQLLAEHRVLWFAFAPEPPLSREQQASAVLRALPHIRRMVASRHASLGIVARIHHDGHVVRLRHEA